MRFDPRPSTRRAVFAALALLAATVLLAGCSSSPTQPVSPFKPMSRVVITPRTDSLVVGGTFLFTAVAYDTSGHVSSAAVIHWGSADPGVASVGTTGLVTAVGEGVGRIIATSGGKSDTVTVYVLGATGGWSVQASNTTNALNAIFVQSDARTGFAVGQGGRLVTTTDGGTTWVLGTSGTAADLHSVWFSSSSVGWAAGSAGTLMKTVDGGTTWIRQTGLTTSSDLLCVRFTDPQHGWVVGSLGLIARTRDGGATWATQNPFAWQLNSVSFTDSLTGWAVGANGELLGTRDGGATWYPYPLGVASQTLKAVSRVSDAVAVAVGTQGTVARSIATGDSLAWGTASVGASDALEGVWMASATNGWAVGSNPNGLILATTDGGGTWTPQTAGVSTVLNAVFFVDVNRGWAVGAGGRILHTSHGGN